MPGTVSDVPVYGCDIFPTICQILDIPLPGDRVIDGASLVPMFGGKPIETFYHFLITPPADHYHTPAGAMVAEPHLRLLD